MVKNKSTGLKCLLDMIKYIILLETGKNVDVRVETENKFDNRCISKTIFINNYKIAKASIDWAGYPGSIEDRDLEVQNHLYFSFIAQLCMQTPSKPEGELYSIKDIIENLK